MAGDRAVVHVFAMWGSIEIRIPDTWAIEVGVVPIMGGVEDKTRGSHAAPTLGKRPSRTFRESRLRNTRT